MHLLFKVWNHCIPLDCRAHWRTLLVWKAHQGLSLSFGRIKMSCYDVSIGTIAGMYPTNVLQDKKIDCFNDVDDYDCG